jgi:UDP-N-acetylmuramoyl-tripeptide--D-alanyl-D-alanine ligase
MSSPVLWQAEDIVRAVRGNSLQEQSWGASGVSIDSRTIRKGDLFIAIKGPAQDGHAHVAAAFAAGAAAAIVSAQPPQVPADAPLVFVDDTLAALQALGDAARARFTGKIIAVTGSVGKTSSKEMLRTVLSAAGTVHASPGSLNNHWGLPLTLANMPPDVDYGVLELGMNHVGELSVLTKLARPHIALITNIEPVHLEFFASVEAIADAKAEIFESMGAEGVAVLNRDNAHYARLAAAAKAQGVKKILSFGKTGGCDARLIDCAVTSEGSAVNATFDGYNIHYAMGAPGEHLVMNSLGVLLAARAAGGNLDICASALTRYVAPERRGARETVALPGGKALLIDESYNASPASVRAMVGVIKNIAPDAGGRRIVVLGDMRELGPTGPALHAALAAPISDAGVDLVFCCGELMSHLHDALPPARRGAHTATSELLAPIVADALRPGDVVCIKGSKSMHLEYVVNALRALGNADSKKIAS